MNRPRHPHPAPKGGGGQTLRQKHDVYQRERAFNLRFLCGVTPEAIGTAQLEALSSRAIVRSICSYWPSPSCWNTIFPLWSTMYWAGQYWLPKAFQVCESLSCATG